MEFLLRELDRCYCTLALLDVAVVQLLKLNERCHCHFGEAGATDDLLGK
jgi:hypothetical protein